MENYRPVLTIVLVFLLIALVLSVIAMATGVPVAEGAVLGLAAVRLPSKMRRRVWKPIELFAARKGYMVQETNKVFRLYPGASADGKPVAPVITKLNELAIADFLMFEPDIREYVDRTIAEPRAVSLEGLSREERDAKVLEMLNG